MAEAVQVISYSNKIVSESGDGLNKRNIRALEERKCI
jgi:hypothetical protein